jgi:cytochrome b involved in lipid metabolism
MLVALSTLILALAVCGYRYRHLKWFTITLLGGAGAFAKHEATTEQRQDFENTDREAPSGPEKSSSIPGQTMAPLEIPMSPYSTPNVQAADAPSPPSISLDESDEESDDLPPPSFPAINSSQRAAGPSINPQRAPPNASLPGNGVNGLMPPPARLLIPNRRPPTISNSLRVPSNGPVPYRGPLSNSLAPPSSSATAIPNPRKKVLLTPGHSPLDWANLQRSSASLSGVKSLLRVTPSMLKHHNGRKGKPMWASYQGKVYNLTPYIPFHPGGEGEIRRAAGKDGEKLFMEVHPWVNWENMLGDCLVGIMVAEHERKEVTNGSLEEMD